MEKTEHRQLEENAIYKIFLFSYLPSTFACIAMDYRPWAMDQKAKPTTMNFSEFEKSIEGSTPPAGLTLCLIALWHDAKGDWHTAHSSIDSKEDKNAYWVHAYLHRKEGDIWNADYWYRRAGKQRPDVTLDDEWASIAKAML